MNTIRMVGLPAVALILVGVPAPGESAAAAQQAADPLPVYRQLLDLRVQAMTDPVNLVVQNPPGLRSPVSRLDPSRLRETAREAGASAQLVEAVGRMASQGGDLSELESRDGIRTLTGDEFHAIFDAAPTPAAAWMSFEERYGDDAGFLHFSPVAFASDGREAAVVETYVCGEECGESRLLILEDGPAGWVGVAEIPLWIP